MQQKEERYRTGPVLRIHRIRAIRDQVAAPKELFFAGLMLQLYIAVERFKKSRVFSQLRDLQLNGLQLGDLCLVTKVIESCN